ncbi:TadE/TadG family type IV pilus assembly protein, partial [Streptomyces sp.]
HAQPPTASNPRREARTLSSRAMGGRVGEARRRRNGAAPGNARNRRERGSAALEFLGVLPILLLIALAGIQLGLVAYTAGQAGTAARTAARMAAKHDPPVSGETAGLDAVSDWLRGGTRIQITTIGGDSVKATATIAIPSVIPGVDVFDPVSRSATMPKEDTTP